MSKNTVRNGVKIKRLIKITTDTQREQIKNSFMWNGFLTQTNGQMISAIKTRGVYVKQNEFTQKVCEVLEMEKEHLFVLTKKEFNECFFSEVVKDISIKDHAFNGKEFKSLLNIFLLYEELSFSLIHTGFEYGRDKKTIVMLRAETSDVIVCLTKKVD